MHRPRLQHTILATLVLAGLCVVALCLCLVVGHLDHDLLPFAGDAVKHVCYTLGAMVAAIATGHIGDVAAGGGGLGGMVKTICTSDLPAGAERKDP
jgi:hypothetical protein